MQNTIFQKILLVFAFFSLLTGKHFENNTRKLCCFNFLYAVILFQEAESFVTAMRNLPTGEQIPLTYNGIFKRTFQDYFDEMSTYEMK